MHIGYQGIENSYSHQVCTKYLDMNKISNDKLKGFESKAEPFTNIIHRGEMYESFNLLFKGLLFGLIDVAVIPIENSIGGCIFLNFDLFYRYNIKIHCEFHHNIKHSLYGLCDDVSKIKKVISHPQALQDCKENLKKHNFESEEYWDTAASIKRIIELNDETIGCIAPHGLGNQDVIELLPNFNDQGDNITRFYLISLKDKQINLNYLLKKELDGKKLVNIKDKFSGYANLKDQIGSLQRYLNKFNEDNINLTKIESRPYLGNDRLDNNPFSYIFYIEGVYNLGNNNTDIGLIDSIDPFYYFGKYSLVDFIGEEKSTVIPVIPDHIYYCECDSSNCCKLTGKVKSDNNINVGIIGFGRFGQFIAERMVKYGFNVCSTSRSDYSEIAEKIGVKFYDNDTFYKECFSKLDIIIFSTSINSFEDVLDNVIENNADGFNNKLVVDVLSVKDYPNDIFKSRNINRDNLVLLTHPMFGPDSAKKSWVGKKFVYWYDYQDLSNFDDKLNINLKYFIKFWENQGCEMVNLDSKSHDFLSANSQFLSHFIGRLLESLNCECSIIDTDLYSNLLKVKDYTLNDSWDLFDGLYKYNTESIETIRRIKFNLYNLIEKLEKKELGESSTGKIHSLINQLKIDGTDILNLAIGESTWNPDLNIYSKKIVNYSSGYSTSKGELKLIDKLIETYKNKNLISELERDNVMITPGGKFGIYLVLKYLSSPGCKWIIPKPYWVSYPDMVASLDCESILIETNVENNWEPSIDELWKLNKGNSNENNIKGFILCNPNNPTGITYTDNFIEDLLKLVIKKKIYLIIDEVYLMINGTIKSLYEKINNSSYTDLSKYLIVVSSFSKYYAIPGWRVGYIFTNKDIINDLSKLQSTITSCASKASQELAYDLLEDNFTPDLSFLNTSRDILVKFFEENGWKMGKPKENEIQMYVFPFNNDINIVNDLEQHLTLNNIFVMKGSAFGIESSLRILLPYSRSDLNRLVYILNSF
jgi:aspartate/methionine/tyrosine aminotransferase/prephenate dehydratase/prephenate dehydrogenase